MADQANLQHQQRLQQYADILQNLRADNLAEMAELLADDVEFKDPFNHARSKAEYLTVMEDMFASLHDIRFVVTRVDATADGGYLLWQFSAYSRTTGTISTEGTSLILFDASGQIRFHRDYWDGSEIMTGIPLFGALVRAVKRRAGTAG